MGHGEDGYLLSVLMGPPLWGVMHFSGDGLGVWTLAAYAGRV